MATNEIVAAAKTNDCERLVRLLSDENPWSLEKRSWWPNRRLIIDEDALSVLETAFQHGSNEAANIIACYAVLGRDNIKDKKPHEIVATKSVWCRCLSDSVINMKKNTSPYCRQHLRGRVEKKDYFYAQPGSKVPGEKRAFYYIVRDHYSKLLTPFEAIERPAAFMALMRLDDNFKILSPEGYTLPAFIIMSKAVIKHDKFEMLKFIEHFDKEIFLVPCGPEGLLPAGYCLKTNNVFLFERLGWSDDIWKESTTGKTVMDYCHNKHFQFDLKKHLEALSAEARIKIYTQVDGALNTFLIRNIKGKKKQRFYDKVALDALETMLKSGKQDQFKELAALVNDRALGAFMVQAGCNFEELMKYACNRAISGKQEHFHSESQGTFDFVNLPLEMLELVMAALTARDILNLFVVNKSMRTWFQQFDSNALWRQILRNSKLALDGDVPMPANDFKKYVLATERTKGNWQSGKFKQKKLFETGRQKEVKMDDNWLWATSLGWVHLVNMHTDEQLSLHNTSHCNELSTCLVESPPFDRPLMALISSKRYPMELFYGRPDSSWKGRIQLSIPPYQRPTVYAQSNDRVVVASATLQVVDLNAQCIVAQLQDGIELRSEALANPFNRSMSIGTHFSSSKFSSLIILDRDMEIVQTMENPDLDIVGMTDEHTIISYIDGEGFALFDIRNLRADNYEMLTTAGKRWHAIDVRNQRMLVDSGPYNIMTQINLTTRRRERVWGSFSGNMFPVINAKYMVMAHESPNGLSTTLVARDFSV